MKLEAKQQPATAVVAAKGLAKRKIEMRRNRPFVSSGMLPDSNLLLFCGPVFRPTDEPEAAAPPPQRQTGKRASLGRKRA